MNPDPAVVVMTKSGVVHVALPEDADLVNDDVVVNVPHVAPEPLAIVIEAEDAVLAVASPQRTLATTVPMVWFKNADDGWVVNPTDADVHVTVNVTALLETPSIVATTLCAPVGAVEEIAKSAVIVVELTQVALVTVTPVPADTEHTAPVRFVPVNVMDTDAPSAPEDGDIEERIGAVEHGSVPLIAR
jgi:hypothetical protein